MQTGGFNALLTVESGAVTVTVTGCGYPDVSAFVCPVFLPGLYSGCDVAQILLSGPHL